MQPHQERVIAEKTELDEKLTKLSSFIGGSVYRSLDKSEQSKMLRQEEAMTVYSSILAERISDFK
jgi:hypothetical protein